MSSIFPLRDTVTPEEDREPRLVDLDEETADDVFDALSSQTTRQIFLALHQTPQTASDLADATETSVQNVQYHLGKLTDAELVEVVDTWYSERGTEMNVYAPKDDSLVLFAGRNKQRTLRSLLDRVVGVFSLLVPVSILAGLGARWGLETTGSDDELQVTAGGGEPGEDTIDAPTTDSSDDGVDIASQPEDSLSVADLGDNETVLFENDTAYVFDDNGTIVVDNATVTDADGIIDSPDDGMEIVTEDTSVVVDGDLAEPGSNVTLSENFHVGDDGELSVTVDEGMTVIEDANVTDTDTTINETEYELVSGDVDVDSSFVLEGDIAEPGSNVTVPVEVVDGAADTTATILGLDPAIAVAAGVLVGGLTIAGGLLAWYGTPGIEAPAEYPKTE